jgi:hypothetical protein
MPHTATVPTREEGCLARRSVISTYLEPGFERLDGFSADGKDA